jgi:hypothetical protein
MADENRNPDIGDAIDASIEHFSDHLLMCLPARVESYDPDRQCVNAQPLTWKCWLAGGDREVKSERYPVVMGAPVLFPGAGKTRRTWPIEKGEMVLLFFASASTDLLMLIGREVDPEGPAQALDQGRLRAPTGHTFNGP